MAQYTIDDSGKFESALKDALLKSGDLTIPFNSMTREWFKANRAQFSLKGPGQYTDLKKKTKKQKAAAGFSVYPILVRNGKLKRSMIVPGDTGSVANIVNKKFLFLGTKVKSKKGHSYPASLHYGTKTGMPKRPVVFAKGEGAAPQQIKKRNKLWIESIKKYEMDISKFGVKK